MKSRKFILFSGLVLMCGLLCGLDKLTGAQLTSVLTVLIPSFGIANAVEHAPKVFEARSAHKGG